MKVESLKTSPDRAGRYWVTFDDGSKMGLYRQTVEDFALYSGKELDEQEAEALRTAAGQMSAKMRAVRIVSASSVSRKDLEQRLDSVHITANKNTVPGETRSPFVTSGVRLGTPAVTTRGMGAAEMQVIADCIADCIWHYEEKKDEISERVLRLTREFPLYQ